MTRPTAATPALLISILSELDSLSVEEVGDINVATLYDGTRLVSVDIPLVDWLRVADSFDLDAGQLPAGGADLLAGTVFVTLRMDGYRLRSRLPLSSIGDVEDVLHLMGVEQLEAWRMLAGVAA